MKKLQQLLSLAGMFGLVAGVVAPAVVSAGAYPGVNGKLAFSSATGVQIINADGSGAVTIPGTDANSGQPRISPDGKKVAWAEYGASVTSPSQVKVANADGTGTATTITTGSSANFRNDGATWSPDAKWVIFAEDFNLANNTATNNLGGHIMIAPSDGSAAPGILINAVSCTGTTTSSDGWEEPAWSANGSHIAVINRCDTANGGIYTFAILGYTAGSGTAPTADLPNAVHVTGSNSTTSTDYWPSWSPDNTNIIFTRANTSTTYTIQKATNTASATLTQLYDAGAGNSIIMAAYSPDGTKIAFNQGTSGTYALQTMAAAGGTATAVPSTTGAGSTDWGPVVGTTLPGGSGNGNGNGNSSGGTGSTTSTPAAAPKAPNTGLAAYVANPFALLVSTFGVTAVILFAARRLQTVRS